MAAAAGGLLPSSEPFRPAMSAQPPTPLSAAAVQQLDREAPKPIGTPSASSSGPLVQVLIRRLPLNTTEESLRLMLVWSTELSNIEILPVDQSDSGFRSAILKIKTMTGALEVKKMLDGCSNVSKDAQMIVDILSPSPTTGDQSATELASATHSSATSSATSSGSDSRHPPRRSGAFQSLGKITPPTNGFSTSDLQGPEASSHYHNIFSPQSAIGSHLTDRPRVTSKALINDSSLDDDETSDLLKDPVAYAKSGAAAQRRATAPQIPLGALAGLSLNTSVPGPSSMPQYMSPVAAHQNPISPVNGPGRMPSYTTSQPPYQPPRSSAPPANPADQNPPCNTLYVGNLPTNTSEEELKAMFGKQRGYKRLCFRTKQNGPMCFVEFEDITFATKALDELYGLPLHNSVKGGIRLSFSKNPLGVRSSHTSAHVNHGHYNGMQHTNGSNGFASTNGPPPGLSAPPGLPPRNGFNGPPSATTANYGGNHIYSPVGHIGSSNSPWNHVPYGNGLGSGAGNGFRPSNPNFVPPHMMGR